MSKKVLITYATKYGTTREIATKLQEIIEKAGNEVSLEQAGDAANVGDYDVVILGSAIYIGRWRKDAIRFMEEHQDILAEKAFFIFSSGPTGEGDPEELLKGWKYPSKLEPLVKKTSPDDIVVFHGNMEMEKLSGMEKWMIKNIKAAVGDFRDWEIIENWGKKIADLIRD